MRTSLALLCVLVTSSSFAEEGMWLLNDFPSDQVKAKYGFAPDAAWLQKVQRGAVRLAGGCSASFVSPRGLVMTNHHCIRSCIEDLSTPKTDYLATGVVPPKERDEKRCPKVEANQLVEMTDVTDQVQAATAGKQGAAFNDALKAVGASLESGCATSKELRCDLVTLFHGGKYHLYKYRRFQDVRLSFAPEFPMAAFGGDPDNFNFPRYGFDAAFLRVYENGKPAATPDYLRWAKTGIKPNELVFVAGHPGGTERVQTVEQLAFQRDTALPYFVAYLAEQRGLLLMFQQQNPELFRISRARLRSVENGLKALRGRHAFLADPEFFASKAQQDAALRQKVKVDAALQAKFGGAWQGITGATDTYRRIFTEYRLAEAADAFDSELFDHARVLVRAAEEKTKPDAQRLREFTDARRPTLLQPLLGDAPISKELEELTLSFSLRRLRETLGFDHPLVHKVMGRQSPEELARKLASQTKLYSADLRKALYDGGAEAISASKDPMILLARTVDAEARAVRKMYEEQVDAQLKKNGELLNQAHVAVHGTSGYPDATFTLRLSYGQVQGWEESGRHVPAMTYFSGLFDRNTGKFPFAVAPTWLKAKPKLSLQTPMNLATTNDIIGGNSGSPLVNQNGEVVGLVFDGNLPSLAGRYGYDGKVNRAVAVHGDAILAALRTVYGATRIADELAPR